MLTTNEPTKMQAIEIQGLYFHRLVCCQRPAARGGRTRRSPCCSVPPRLRVEPSTPYCSASKFGLSLVRRWSVNGRHRDVVQAQVDAQLTAVVDQVVHQEGAEGGD